LVGEYCIDETGDHGLKYLADRYFGVKMIEFGELKTQTVTKLREERKAKIAELKTKLHAGGPRKGGMKATDAWRLAAQEIHRINTSEITAADFDLEPLAKYAENDAYYTWRLQEVQEVKLENEGMANVFYAYEMPMLHILYDMEKAGIGIDPHQIYRILAETRYEITRVTEQLRNYTQVDFNPNSNDQLANVIFNCLKISEPARFTSTGGVSVDEDTLRDLYLQSNHPFLLAIINYRKLIKKKGTYLEPLLEWADQDYRIHTTFNQTITRTGRLSSSRPNLQNIQKDEDNVPEELKMRNIFVAQKRGTRKCVFVKADINQAELRLLAHESGCPVLRNVYSQGEDIHKMTQLSLGIDRKPAKVINFGIIYGMHWKTLQANLLYDHGIRVSDEDAQKWQAGVYATYYGITPWKEEVLDFAYKNMYVQNLYGRKRHLPHIRSQDYSLSSYAKRQAVNFKIQGGVGDIVKRWMVHLQRKLRPYDARILLQVHDELLIEVPEEHYFEVAQLTKTVGEEDMKELTVPWKIEIEVGERWGQMEKVL
jgi:DNA polymerase-1